MIRVGSRVQGFVGAPEGVAVEGPGVWLVYVVIDGVTRSEEDAVSKGPISLAVDQDGPCLVWIVGLDGLHSAAVWPRWAARRVETPALPPGVGGLAQVVLIESRTGEVRALRSVGLTKAVAERIEAMSELCESSGRDEAAFRRLAQWSRTAEPDELKRRSDAAPALTWVPAKGAA